MKNTVSESLSLEVMREAIDCLGEFMLPERVERLRQVLDMRTRYMTVCMENIFHPQNASALVRHCDAFGIQDIHTIEEICRFRPNVNIVKGTDKWVTFHRHENTEQAIGSLRRSGYRIIATTPHEGNCSPEDFDLAAGPFALFFGTEHQGVSDMLKEHADGFVRIPMCGFVESLNVSASAAIIMYILSSGLRCSEIEWELKAEEKIPLLYRWMRSTVKDSERILKRSMR